ncbi:EcsC family protein [Bacillus sp. DJP31]|uniref:EcsC family protein n=1 Tax=Bacillus sp. DJP31 TaxID=3409789 RepID=UPI003BB60B7A
MSLSERDLIVLEKIRNWEQQLDEYEASFFEQSYEKWLERAFEQLPPKLQDKFYTMLDGWFVQLHALLQGSQLQSDARQRILHSAQNQHPHIQDVQDLRQLPIDRLIYFAEQEISNHRLYSFAQGGLAGAGGFLFIAADIPLMLAINLRAVQLLSLIYGKEVNTPYEMVTSLKVFHAATLPKHHQGKGWRDLVSEIEEDRDSFFWYDGTVRLTDGRWMELPLKQLIKSLFILLFKRKLIQGIPLIGMGIGAGMNYGLTRQVTGFAHHFYQLRYLMEKGD